MTNMYLIVIHARVPLTNRHLALVVHKVFVRLRTLRIERMILTRQPGTIG